MSAENTAEVTREQTAESVATSRHMDAFLDETWIEINGRKAIIFATVIPRDLGAAAAALAAIKKKHGLTPTTEIKWSSKSALSPQAKAAIKQDTLEALTPHFACLICVTEDTDKTLAFTNALRQVHDFVLASGERSSRRQSKPAEAIDLHVTIHHDEDAFQDRAPVLAELTSWTDVTCSGLTRANSALTAGIQYADILGGTFSYALRVKFGAQAKLVTVPDDYGGTEEWPLDQLFQVLLRWNVWGEVPPVELTPEEERRIEEGDIPWREEFFTAKCLGKGVRVHGSFSSEEMAILDEAATYYRGCMH